MNTLVLDFETSGLNPYHSDVIEIGAKIMETGETFSSIIRPKSEMPISDKISGEDVAIVSHNGITFDFIILKQIIKHLREGGCDTSVWEHKHVHYIDSLLFARRLLLNQQSFKQITLCKRFGIQVIISHRALADVEALEQLYQTLLYLHAKREGRTDPQGVLDYIDLKD
jgi:DNA polymerase III alpha subunit (gram-positive type)